jgi:hypothetical protein
MAKGNGAASAKVLGKMDVKRLADERAQEMLQVRSSREAFRLLDEGKLDGTIAEAEFKMLRFLMK